MCYNCKIGVSYSVYIQFPVFKSNYYIVRFAAQKGLFMDTQRLFRAFRGKLLLACMLRAFLWALTFGGVGVFAVSLYHHIRIQPTPVESVIWAGGVGFLPVFVICLILGFPTRKRVAARVDGLGLQERAGTMLAYEKEDTVMARLQRQDAAAHISTTGAKKMRLGLKRSVCILCAVSVVLATAAMALPYDVFAFGEAPDPEEQRQQELIRNMIDDLRENNRESQMDEPAKDAVQQILDELEEALANAENELERAALIEQAREKIQQLQKTRQVHDKIGEALQKYEMTAPLGGGIVNKSKEEISPALDGLELLVTETVDRRMPLCETIVDALGESGVDEQNGLFCAVAAISVDLNLTSPEKATYAQDVAKAMDRALQDIMAALQSQQTTEDALNQLDDMLSDTKDELLGKESEEDEETEEAQKNNKENQKNPALDLLETVPEDDSALPEGDLDQVVAGGAVQSTMTEGFYDPVLGYVSYGEVYATYYAEYLQALRDGQVPEELQEKIDKYFSGLE